MMDANVWSPTSGRENPCKTHMQEKNIFHDGRHRRCREKWRVYVLNSIWTNSEWRAIETNMEGGEGTHDAQTAHVVTMPTIIIIIWFIFVSSYELSNYYDSFCLLLMLHLHHNEAFCLDVPTSTSSRITEPKTEMIRRTQETSSENILYGNFRRKIPKRLSFTLCILIRLEHFAKMFEKDLWCKCVHILRHLVK